MKKCYEIGFNASWGWNGLYTIRGLAAARELAAEVETEYSEKPIIREFKPGKKVVSWLDYAEMKIG